MNTRVVHANKFSKYVPLVVLLSKGTVKIFILTATQFYEGFIDKY